MIYKGVGRRGATFIAKVFFGDGVSVVLLVGFLADAMASRSCGDFSRNFASPARSAVVAGSISKKRVKCTNLIEKDKLKCFLDFAMSK